MRRVCACEYVCVCVRVNEICEREREWAAASLLLLEGGGGFLAAALHPRLPRNPCLNYYELHQLKLLLSFFLSSFFLSLFY